jgi:DNA-binding response OmpR family regulator
MKSNSVLVVDDDPSALELICEVLEADGIYTFAASNGVHGLQLATKNPGIRAVVSDIRMPEMDGFTFMRRIREVSSSPPAFVLMTGNASIECAIRALRLGACDFFLKPIWPTQLLEVVRRVLNGSQHKPDSPARTQGAAALSTAPKEGDISSQALVGINELAALRRSSPILNSLDVVEFDLLLELVRAERAGRRLSVSALSLTVDSNQASAATALRRIHSLVRSGLIERVPDECDARRDFVMLAPEARAAVNSYLSRAAEVLKISVNHSMC